MVLAIARRFGVSRTPPNNDELGRFLADLAPIVQALNSVRRSHQHTAAAAVPLHEFAALDPAEQAHAFVMGDARKQEFSSGRAAAKHALRDAGAAVLVVPADQDGVPVFPNGYIGSIAHKHGRAVAVAAAAAMQDHLSIGIDLEFDDGPDEDLEAEILSGDEDRELLVLGRAHTDLRSPANILVAAKEAVYKAVYPLIREEFAFDDLTLAFDTQRRAFRPIRYPGSADIAVSGFYGCVDRWIVAIADAFGPIRRV